MRGGVVLDAKDLDRRLRVRRDDDEVLWQGALSESEQLGVERELEDRAALRLLRELGVDDVIRPVAERALGVGRRRSTSGRPNQWPLRNAGWRIASTPARMASSERATSSSAGQSTRSVTLRPWARSWST